MSPATKGERTRAAILDEALRIVSKAGLDSVTIGTLAEATGMSKSGLFAHFGSREELLLAVLAYGQDEFTAVVFKPAMDHPRGIPRLRAMFVNWLDWTESAELPGGCPMIGGATEFDDKPGPIRVARLAWPVRALAPQLSVAGFPQVWLFRIWLCREREMRAKGRLASSLVRRLEMGAVTRRANLQRLLENVINRCHVSLHRHAENQRVSRRDSVRSITSSRRAARGSR